MRPQNFGAFLAFVRASGVALECSRLVSDTLSHTPAWNSPRTVRRTLGAAPCSNVAHTRKSPEARDVDLRPILSVGECTRLSRGCFRMARVLERAHVDLVASQLQRSKSETGNVPESLLLSRKKKRPRRGVRGRCPAANHCRICVDSNLRPHFYHTGRRVRTDVLQRTTRCARALFGAGRVHVVPGSGREGETTRFRKNHSRGRCGRRPTTRLTHVRGRRVEFWAASFGGLLRSDFKRDETRYSSKRSRVFNLYAFASRDTPAAR